MSGVQGKFLDATQGAKLEFEFGKPTGERLGHGSQLGKERFLYQVTGDGVKTDTTKADAMTLGVGDPVCFDATAQARAIGVEAPQSFELEYRLDSKRKKGVWRLSPARVDAAEEGTDESRLLDGRTCAILVR
jgi:hypothetical protein